MSAALLDPLLQRIPFARIVNDYKLFAGKGFQLRLNSGTFRSVELGAVPHR